MKTREIKPSVSLKEKTSVQEMVQFPVVGIGASAGGLEALEQFLGNVPENSGLAYVVIQHLDPTQKGMLPELLQRISGIEVIQVKNRMVVKQNRIYVIPPNKSMSILNGMFHLSKPIESRGLRLPIDFFFRSLANDRKELAVGIILSGMGSDGSIGLRDIKENNGIIMVQEPSTAKFDSMPRNAIDSVIVDIVAPPSELPEKLYAFLKHIPVTSSDADSQIKDTSSLEKIIILLRTITGNDFMQYKRNTVYRRIERRMGIHKIKKISSYVSFLLDNPKEVQILFKELMIGVTNFFRDYQVWEYLKEKVIPDMIGKFRTSSLLRAWVPGCSTGEEAYSLAMVFKETLEESPSSGGISLQIFATDLDNDAIDIARKGIFPVNIAADVSPERLKRFFIKTDEGYRINTEIREMVVFAQHNLIMHPPFTKIDILSCRNLLIYMDSELQTKILALFFNSLHPEGIMVLGNAETLGNRNHLFATLEPKLKIFKRSNTVLSPELYNFPASFSQNKKDRIHKQMSQKPNINIQTLADQLLLQQYAPVGVLVNEDGDIIYTSGRTGKYLEPAVGKANMNIFAMLREGLRNEFPVAFRKSILKKETVIMHNVRVGTNGGTQTLNVTIHWIDKPESLNGMVMIIFNDVPEHTNSIQTGTKKVKASKSMMQRELEKELEQTREEMQKSFETMQTSQEEQKSTNEELQSANEELQSTNEELTTSKEEMQSLNEELQTVNAELQSKVDEFLRVDNDMKNLLNSTDIATLFLDKELNIRRYTNQATKIFKLIKSDIGRPFTDQVSDLIYPELAADAIEVLRTLIFVQKQIPAKDGRWFSIRIMPYRTFDDRIDGLVITFINITDHMTLETELNESKLIHRLLFNSSSDVIIKLSDGWNIIDFNPQAELFFETTMEQAKNQNFIQSFIPEKYRKKTEKEMKSWLNEANGSKIKLQVITKGGTALETEWVASVIYNNMKLAAGMILLMKKKDID
ncbi:MAG: chemotaxis protein CheB [Bacteroidales bacterium]